MIFNFYLIFIYLRDTFVQMVKQKMEQMEHRPFSKKEANDGFEVETLESLIKMVSQPSFCEVDIKIVKSV